MKIKLLHLIIFIAAIFSSVSTTARTKNDMLNELNQAAKISLSTLDKSGIYGLINKIEKCYSIPKKDNNENYKCIYLDVVGRYLEQVAIEELKVSQKPFFKDDQFGSRIGPVLGREGMDINEANVYIDYISTVLEKMVNEEIIRRSKMKEKK